MLKCNWSCLFEPVLCSFCTQGANRAGLLGCLALLCPWPRYVSYHSRAAEVLWRQDRRLRSRWKNLYRWRSSRFLIGVGNLISVRRRASSRNQDGLTDCGGRPVALARGGREEGPWGGVVGRRAGGDGAAGWRRGGTSSSHWTTSWPSSVWWQHGRWAVIWRERKQIIVTTVTCQKCIFNLNEVFFIYEPNISKLG